MAEIELDNDIEVNFTIFKNEYSGKPTKHAKTTFSKLLTFLDTPHIGGKKSNGCFIGGTVKEWRNNCNTVDRSILTVDIDDVPADVDVFSEISSHFYYGFALYPTYNHTPENPRYRLLIPLGKCYKLTPDTYRAIIHYLCRKVLDINYYDASSEVLSQVMYFPTTEHPEHYELLYQDEEVFTITEAFIDAARTYTGAGGEGFAVIYDKKPIASAQWEEILSPKHNGEGRNEAMTKLLGSLLRRYVDTEIAYYLLRLWNDHHYHPLDNQEFDKTFSSILKSEMQRRTAKEMRWDDDVHNA